MGKGDKKTKRGKISMGSYGVTRPSRTKVSEVVQATKEKVAKVKKTAATEEKPKKKVTKKKEGE
jgi:30S ribosomal protein S31